MNEAVQIQPWPIRMELISLRDGGLEMSHLGLFTKLMPSATFNHSNENEINRTIKYNHLSYPLYTYFMYLE